MEPKERTLTLFTDKRKIFFINLYPIFGHMVEQTSNGWDIYLSQDNKGAYFHLKVKRGTYIIK